MKLSVLISCYNGKNDLPDLLRTLEENLSNIEDQSEVIVRDDNSTDGSADLLEGIPWLHLIRGDDNLGFVQSNNLIFEKSQGEVICCLNQDTILTPSFLQEGLRILEDLPHAVGVNTNMIMPWVMSKDEFLEKDRGKMPAWEYQFTKYGFAQYVEVEPGIRETNFMTGGAFFLRRSALRKDEKLFDPAIHMYCEDTDLSLRLTKRGKKIIYISTAIVFHNQLPKKITTFSAGKKLLNITWTRFQVLARNTPFRKFLVNYPLYLKGIIKKIDSLGFSSRKNIPARIIALVTAALFALCLPFFCVVRK